MLCSLKFFPLNFLSVNLAFRFSSSRSFAIRKSSSSCCCSSSSCSCIEIYFQINLNCIKDTSFLYLQNSLRMCHFSSFLSFTLVCCFNESSRRRFLTNNIPTHQISSQIIMKLKKLFLSLSFMFQFICFFRANQNFYLTNTLFLWTFVLIHKSHFYIEKYIRKWIFPWLYSIFGKIDLIFIF